MLKNKGVQKVDNDGENANSCPLINHHPPDLRNNTPTKWIPGAVGTIRAIKPCYLIVQMAKLRPLKEEICPRPHCTSVVEKPGSQIRSQSWTNVDSASRGRCSQLTCGTGSLRSCDPWMKGLLFPSDLLGWIALSILCHSVPDPFLRGHHTV